MPDLLPAFVGAPEADHVYHCNALTLMKALPTGSVDCCVTSPPYYGLRDYGVDGQIGLEATPEAYVAALVAVFREVRRALRDDGTLWLNLGDSYNGSGKGWTGHNGIGNQQQRQGFKSSPTDVDGLKPKDLIGIPWMVAFALRADGWYLRSDIIWHKPNCMPESVKDRPTKAHETIFLLSKCPHYYYDADAIKTPVQKNSIKRLGRAVSDAHKNANGAPGQTPHSMFRPRPNAKQDGVGSRRYSTFNERYDGQATPMANARSVWRIHPKGFKGAHFATFPTELAERMILAGCPKEVCSVCGAPHVRVTERTGLPSQARPQGRRAMELFEQSGLTEEHLAAIRAVGMADTGKALITMSGAGKNTVETQHLADEAKAALGGYYREFTFGGKRTIGWEPTCTCNADTHPGVVIDPFFGAGTVGVVAQKLGRHWLGSEINPEYCGLARARIAGRFEEYQAQKAGEPFTLPMFTEAL